MRRSFLLIWLLTGLGLVAASAVGFLTPADKSGAVIEEPERVFASMPLGKHEVRIRISNPTRHVVRVVGTSDFCGIGSCFTSKHPLPAEIPPGGAMELIAELQIGRIGEFSSEMYVYLDDLGLRQEVLTASGTATDSGEGESH
ncbi:MAG: hypothetical protein K2X38_13020 [Gemmataceae bacterium]|nr:hypothetical protein [Gemmataceae bacterium]